MEIEAFASNEVWAMRTYSTTLLLAGSCLFLSACAGGGRLNTSTGKPLIALTKADWKRASVAIADYNLSKGRQLDVVRPNEIVLYEAVPAPDGAEQVTTKTIYTISSVNDSLLISSSRFQTDDLDDDSPAELNDQATLDAQQLELAEIARNFSRANSEATNTSIAQPRQSQ
jgi:hypothetical protein